ncbi:MAG: amidohydrolase family protein [Gammaproteobacteria bacterium]
MRALYLRNLFVLLCSAGLFTFLPARTVDSPPDWIYYNGALVTMETDQPAAQAIAIQAEKILAVGSDADVLALRGASKQVVDLHGRALLPGFVDAHTHVLNDAALQNMSLDEAQFFALRNGITTLGDLYVDRPFAREIQDFNASGNLRVRTSLYLVWNTNCGKVLGNWYKEFPPTHAPGEMLRVNGVKIFTDGGSCGHVALSFELTPGEGTGDLWLTQEQLNGAVKEAQNAGYQVAIHAIGDRAIAQALSAIAFALNGQPNTFRHRIEHVSVIPPELIPRFGEIGAIPVLNGEYPSCHPFGPDIPQAYRDWEWPWAELRAANPGLPVAWHSDYPFLSINPFVHLYGFVTRKDVLNSYSSCTPRQWLRDDTLTVQDALSIMTIESAYALFREEEVGSLRPGKYADLIVVSRNPLTVAPEELKDIKPLLTMIGGRIEFCEMRQEALCPSYVEHIFAPRPNPTVPAFAGWGVVVLLTAGGTFFSVRRKAGRRKPPSSRLLRTCGLAAMTGGVGWATVTLPIALGNAGLLGKGWSEPDWLYSLFGLALLGIIGGFVGLSLRQEGRMEAATKAALAVPVVSGVALIFFFLLVATRLVERALPSSAQDWVWPVLLGGLSAFLLGLALSGILLLFARPLPRWTGAILLVAALTLFGFNSEDARAWLGLPFGVAWLLIGFNLRAARACR